MEANFTVSYVSNWETSTIGTITVSAVNEQHALNQTVAIYGSNRVTGFNSNPLCRRNISIPSVQAVK